MNTFKYDICEALELDYGKTIQEASTVELYDAVSKAMMKAVAADWRKPYEGKQACYFSAEFLIGRLIYNNLLNLGLYTEAQQLLARHGVAGRLPFIAVDEIEKDHVRVVFQGVEGAYSHAAMCRYFGESAVPAVDYVTIR